MNILVTAGIGLLMLSIMNFLYVVIDIIKNIDFENSEASMMEYITSISFEKLSLFQNILRTNGMVFWSGVILLSVGLLA